MKTKKRKKSTRFRGTHTHGRGGKKKARGSGHRGGFGMAGTGKRADQRKSFITNLDKEYFGKEGLKPKKRRYIIINVRDIEKLVKGKKEIDLTGYKILAEGEIKDAITITADSVSESAAKKIKNAGGNVIIKKNSEKSL